MLSLIEALLKYSNKHSSSIIVTLLGIMIVGGIGGGLWIQNLNSVIVERNKLEEQRLALADERQGTALAATRLQHQSLNQEVISIVDKLEFSTSQSTSRLRDLGEDLLIAGTAKGLSPGFRNQILSVSQGLRVQSSAISKDVTDTRASIHAALSGPELSVDTGHHYLRSPALGLLPYLLLLLASSVTVAALLFRQRNKRRRAMVHLNNACDLLPESVRQRDLQRFEQAALRNELKSVLDELEALGTRVEDLGQLPFDSSFWKELTQAANTIGARDRAKRYRRRAKHDDSPEL